MKRMTTIVLVAAMILSMSAPATAAKTRTVKKTTTSATTPVSSEYTIKMVGNTIQFMKGGVIVRSAVTKDGKITLKKNSQGGISVIFKNKNGKMSNITFGKQDDVKLSGTFAQVAVDKTLGANSTITLEKGSKVTSFTTKGEAKILINGNVTTLNSANKKANIVVTGSVSKAYAMSKKTISGMSSSKITVNETGTSSNSTSSSNTTDWPAYEKPSYNGGSSNGNWSGSNGGTTEEKPEEKPVTPTPTPPPTPDPPAVKPTDTMIFKSLTSGTFNEDVTIVTNGVALSFTAVTFNGKVTVVEKDPSAGAAAAAFAGRETAKPNTVTFGAGTTVKDLYLAGPVSLDTAENSNIGAITVAEGTIVPKINLVGSNATVTLGTDSNVINLDISGIGTPSVSGAGTVTLATLTVASSKKPGLTITAGVTEVTTTGTDSAGTITVGGNNSSTKVNFGTNAEGLNITGSAKVEATVAGEKTVKDVTSSSTVAGSSVKGAGTVTNASQTSEKSLTVDTNTKPKDGVTTITLDSIKAVYTQDEKTIYYVGDKFDISKLVVTGTYSKTTKNGEPITKTEPITAANLSVTTVTVVGANKITVTVGGKTADFTVTGTAASLAGIVINAKDLKDLKIGETAQLTAGQVWNGPQGNAPITWASSDATKATVDANGKVTAVAAGTTKITAKSGDKITSNEITITVLKADAKTAAVTKVTQGEKEIKPVNGIYTIARGDSAGVITVMPNFSETSKEYTATLTPPTGSAVEQEFTTALTAGTAIEIPVVLKDKNLVPGIYTYSATIGDSNLSISFSVPAAAAVTGVTVTPSVATMKVGGTLDMKAAVSTVGEVADENKTVTWSAADVVESGKTGKEEETAVVSIDSTSGKVTANKAGTATITATVGTAKDGSAVTGTATITVGKTAEITAVKQNNNDITAVDGVYPVTRDGGDVTISITPDFAAESKEYTATLTPPTGSAVDKKFTVQLTAKQAIDCTIGFDGATLAAGVYEYSATIGDSVLSISFSVPETTPPTIELPAPTTITAVTTLLNKDTDGKVTVGEGASLPTDKFSATLTKGSVDYKNVQFNITVTATDSGDISKLQLIAQDSEKNYYDVVTTKVWGSPAGFALTTATTEFAVACTHAGTYTITVELVNVAKGKADNVLATASSVLTVTAKTEEGASADNIVTDGGVIATGTAVGEN